MPSHCGHRLDQVLIGGPDRRPIVVVTYDRAWPERFRAERERTGRALGQTAQSVEHIGSTAVPGLAAKPIIDILLVVEDVDDEPAYGPALERSGYVLRVREPGLSPAGGSLAGEDAPTQANSSLSAAAAGDRAEALIVLGSGPCRSRSGRFSARSSIVRRAGPRTGRFPSMSHFPAPTNCTTPFSLSKLRRVKHEPRPRWFHNGAWGRLALVTGPSCSAGWAIEPGRMKWWRSHTG